MTSRVLCYGSLLCCVGAVFVLYGNNLMGFWRADDPAILLHTLLYNPLSNFHDPQVWQALSVANLTPLLPLSYYLDYVISGLSPFLYYLHQLLVMAGAAWLTFMWLQLHVKPVLAGGVSLLFLLGLPVALTVSQLMTRHYLEGLLGCLLALYAATRLQRSAEPRWLTLFVAGFALAVMAKEVYVPLGLALALDALWRRWTAQPQVVSRPVLLTAGIVTLLYIPWRQWMLPELVGGYSSSRLYLDPAYWQRVLQSMAGFPRLLFGAYSIWIMLPLLVLLAVQLACKPRSFPLLLLWAGAILLPLAPLVDNPGIRAADRYLLLPWFGLCCFIAFASETLRKSCSGFSRPGATAVLTLAPLLLLVGGTGIHLWRSLPMINSDMARSDTLMGFVWQADANSSFIPDPGMAAAWWSVTDTAKIKQLRDASASVPLMVSDDLLLDAGKPLFQYDPACHCMLDISSTVPERLASLQAAQDTAADLHIEMRNDAGVLTWSFGPYQTGQYQVVSQDVGKRVLPREQAGLNSLIREPVTLQIKYQSPEGWFTASPELELQPDGSVLRWSRTRP
jgi:hypothetical protein